jgi:hypothetical protein
VFYQLNKRHEKRRRIKTLHLFELLFERTKLILLIYSRQRSIAGKQELKLPHEYKLIFFSTVCSLVTSIYANRIKLGSSNRSYDKEKNTNPSKYRSFMSNRECYFDIFLRLKYYSANFTITTKNCLLCSQQWINSDYIVS